MRLTWGEVGGEMISWVFGAFEEIRDVAGGSPLLTQFPHSKMSGGPVSLTFKKGACMFLLFLHSCGFD